MKPGDQINEAIKKSAKGLNNKEMIKKAVRDCFNDHGSCKYFPFEQDILEALGKKSLTEDELAEAEQMWNDAWDEYHKEYEKWVMG
jgi:hypothetical protein